MPMLLENSMRSVPGLALTSAICDELAGVSAENPNLSRLRTILQTAKNLGGTAYSHRTGDPDTVNLLVLAAQLKRTSLGAGSSEPALDLSFPTL